MRRCLIFIKSNQIYQIDLLSCSKLSSCTWTFAGTRCGHENSYKIFPTQNQFLFKSNAQTCIFAFWIVMKTRFCSKMKLLKIVFNLNFKQYSTMLSIKTQTQECSQSRLKLDLKCLLTF